MGWTWKGAGRERRSVNSDDANKRPAIGVKDVLSLSLSLLAFILSIITGYFTVFRQVDDIRLDIPAHAVISWVGKEDELIIFARHSLTFINAGNRAAAITSAELYFAVNQDNCRNIEGSVFIVVPLMFEGFALKPNEVFTTNMTPSGKVHISERYKEYRTRLIPVDVKVKENDDDIYIPVVKPFEDKKTKQIAVCYKFRISTPLEGIFEPKLIDIFELETNEGNEFSGMPEYISSVTKTLYFKRSNILHFESLCSILRLRWCTSYPNS